MKLERWRLEYGAMYSDELGEVCLTKDVAELEASHAELLVAAKRLLSLYESHGWQHPAINAARAAIAKAEGEVMP